MIWNSKLVAILARALGIAGLTGLAAIVVAVAFAVSSQDAARSHIPFGTIIPIAATLFVIGIWGWGWLGGIREQSLEFTAIEASTVSIGVARDGDDGPRRQPFPAANNRSRWLKATGIAALACAAAASALAMVGVLLNWRVALELPLGIAAAFALFGGTIALWLRIPFAVDPHALAALSANARNSRAWASEQTASVRWLAERFGDSRLQIGARTYWALGDGELSLWVRGNSELVRVIAIRADAIKSVEAQWVPRMFDYQPGVVIDLSLHADAVVSVRTRVVHGIGNHSEAASDFAEAIRGAIDTTSSPES